MISLLAAAQAATTICMVPETLPKESRIPIDQALNIKATNPFGFVQIYTKGSTALQKMVTLTTMQFFGEGKNVSDYGLQWWVNNLKWSTLDVRNFVMGYGMTWVAGGILLIPKMVASLSARQ